MPDQFKTLRLTVCILAIVLTFLVSLFFYKEKLSKWQILGSALGLVSVIFLNL